MSARSRRLTRSLRSNSGSQSSQERLDDLETTSLETKTTQILSVTSTKSTANAALLLGGSKNDTEGGPAVSSPQSKATTRRSSRAAVVQAAVAAQAAMSSPPKSIVAPGASIPSRASETLTVSPSSDTQISTLSVQKTPPPSRITPPKQTPQLSAETSTDATRVISAAASVSPPVYPPNVISVEEDWLEERLKTLEAPTGTGYDGMGDIIDSYLVLHTANREHGFVHHPEYLQNRAKRFADPLLRHITAAPPDAAAFHEQLQDASAKALPYSQPPELNLAQASLRWTGFFLSQTNIVRQLDVSVQTRFIQALVSNLKNHAHRDKSTINLTIWCLTVQSLGRDTIASHTPDIIAALDMVFDAKFNSASVEHEALRTYVRLLDQVPNVMGQAPVAVQWGTRTIARLTSDAIGVRRKALEVMHAGIVPLTVAYRSAVARGRLVRYLKHNDYAALATLKAHAGTNNADDKQIFLVKAWTYLITLLGPGAKLARADGRALGNQLLALLYAPFKMGSPVLEHTLTAWSVLMDVLTQPYTDDADGTDAAAPASPATEEKLSTSTVRMLLKPLLRPLDAALVDKGAVNVPSVNDARVRAWWHLVTNVPAATATAKGAELVLLPLLRFVGAAPSGGVTEGVEALEALHAEILAHLVAPSDAQTSATALRPLPHPVSDEVFALPEVHQWVLAGVQREVETLAAHPERTVAIVAAVSARIRAACTLPADANAPAAASTLPARACTMFVDLVTVLSRVWTPLPPLTAAAVQVVNAVVRTVPAALLCAPQCAIVTPAGLPRASSDPAVHVSPLEFFACVVLHPRADGTDSNALYTRTEFFETFNCLVRGASGSPAVLRHLGVVVHHMAALGPRLPRPVHALKYWEKVGSVLVKSPEVYEGEEHAPDFACFINTLALPLQWAERQPLVLQYPDFVKKWSMVLDAFCLGAVLLPCGSRYHHLACLNQALLHVDLATLATNEDALAAAFSCVAATMAHVKTIRTPAAELAHGDGPHKSGGLLRPQLLVMQRVMEVGGRRLAALGWPQQLPYYEHVLVAFNTLLEKFNHRATMDAVAVRILPKLLDLLAHAFKENTASKVLHARAPRVGLSSAIVRLWETVALKLAGWIDPSPTKGDDAGLGALADMFAITLGHTQPAVVQAAVELWNSTFGNQPWMVVPPTLQTVIARANRHGAAVHVPNDWIESQNVLPESQSETLPSEASSLASNSSPSRVPARLAAQSDAVRSASPLLAGASRSPKLSPRPKRRSFLHRSEMGTPRTLEVVATGHESTLSGSPSKRSRVLASSLSPTKGGRSPSGSPKKAAASPSKKRPNVYEEDSQKFVTIVPSPKKPRAVLTPHQRERKKEQQVARRERVTLYTNNEESQDTLADTLDTLADDADPIPLVALDDKSAPTATPTASTTRATPLATGARGPPVQPLPFAIPAQPAGGAAAAAEGQLSPPSILKRKASAAAHTAETRRRRRRVSFDLEQNKVHVNTPETRRGADATGGAGVGGSARDTGARAAGMPTHAAADGSAPTSSRPVPNPMPIAASTAAVALSGSSNALMSTPVDVGKNAFFSSPPPVGLSPLVGSGAKTRSRGEMMISTLSSSPTRAIKTNIVSESPAPLVAMRVVGAQRSLEPAFQSRQPSQAPEGDQVIFPSLSACGKPVTEILHFFSMSVQRRIVLQLLKGKQVTTVGKFCSLPQREFNTLPLKLTARTHGELHKYHHEYKRKTTATKSNPLARAVKPTPSPPTQPVQVTSQGISETQWMVAPATRRDHVTTSATRPGLPLSKTNVTVLTHKRNGVDTAAPSSVSPEADTGVPKSETITGARKTSSAVPSIAVVSPDGTHSKDDITVATGNANPASILQTLSSLSSASQETSIDTLPQDQLLAMHRTLADLMRKVGTAIAPPDVSMTPAPVASET